MPNDCKIGLRSRGICVIIPTYNNAGTIVDVVTRTQSYCDDIFVILDGCTDETRSKLEAMANKPDVVVIEKNTGKGNALKVGFKTAAEAGFAYAITIDADGQHYPEDIPLFLKANRLNPGALIIGNRSGLENVVRSRGSRFANSFSNFWFFLQTLIPLKDTQTGFRLYPLKHLPFSGLLPSRYEAELGLLVFSAWRGVKIVSQDVRVFYPSEQERVSHFRPFSDFTRIFLFNILLCILALVYGLPRTILRCILKFCKTYFIFFLYIISMILFVMPCLFVYLKCGGSTEKKKENLHGFICRSAKKGLSFLGLFGNRYSLAGHTEEDFRTPAIITCNHQSHLDLLPMLALTPKLVVLTADWVWHNPLYGFIIREADFLPASHGLDAIAPRLGELIKKGYSIVVYPESTRSEDCSIGRFHQGAFYLAERFDVDILPVVLYGAGKALPKHGRILNRWPVRLEIDGRITQEEIKETGASFISQASYLRKYYSSRYAEIADKIEQTV